MITVVHCIDERPPAAGLAAVQGRQEAGGVLRRAAAEVAAGVRAVARRRRAARQARALRLTPRLLASSPPHAASARCGL